MQGMGDGRKQSDALVLFGVTGDLAYKKIFPALYALVKQDLLDVPVVGVASSPWNLEQLRERIVQSVGKSGREHDPAALARLVSLFRYVRGDYNSPATFKMLKRELGNAERPAHYLAIPPLLFGEVIKGLGAEGLEKKCEGDCGETVRSGPCVSPGTQ